MHNNNTNPSRLYSFWHVKAFCKHQIHSRRRAFRATYVKTIAPPVSELSGSLFPTLVFTGARLQAAGPGCGQGRVLWEGASQQSMAQLLAVHHPRADGMAGWHPELCLCKPELLASRSCLKPPTFVCWQILFIPATHEMGAPLNWPVGLASVRGSCQGAKIQ